MSEPPSRPVNGTRFRLPNRLRTAVFIFFMTFLMGLVLSAIMTFQAQGLEAGFVVAWLNKFAKTYVLVVPTVLVVSPIANRLTDALVQPATAEAARKETAQ